MDTSAIEHLISNLGFPIAVNIFLIYVLYQIGSKLMTEIGEMKTAIQLNTKELSELRTTIKDNMGGGK